MFVNKYTISLSSIGSGSTATTINIPVSLEYQLVDNSELIEKEFVDVEVNKAINPIVDYDKVRFIPLDQSGNYVHNVFYQVSVLSGGTILNPTTYHDIGFVDEDILFRRANFTSSYLYLRFFDSDIALSQNLINDLYIYSMITDADLYPIGSTIGVGGQPKPATQIPVKFTLSNPLSNPRGFAEGYHLYDYKSGYALGYPKYLYMRATFVNAKSGKSINLMTEPTAYAIDTLVNKLYTRYELKRDATGFYYSLDTTYSNNVSYTTTTFGGDNLLISLYQIQST